MPSGTCHSETIRLMTEIDAVIETHGGWQEAFYEAAPEAQSNLDN